jgi:hypothetical protein
MFQPRHVILISREVIIVDLDDQAGCAQAVGNFL